MSLEPPPDASTASEDSLLQRALPWVVGVVLAIGCAWLAQLYLVARVENRLLVSQQSLADLELRSARHQLEAEHVIAKHQIATLKAEAQHALDPAQWQLAILRGHSPEAFGVVAWSPAEQCGVLRVEQLPVAAPAASYALWVIDPTHPQPVSAGAVSVGADGRGRTVFRPAAIVGRTLKFLVTREPSGTPAGSEPRGPEVLAGQ